MRVAAPIIAIFLTYLMIPGAGELTENAVHLITHGDTAHGGGDGHSDTDPSGEHGCSGPYHTCLCHKSSTFLAADALFTTAVTASAERCAVSGGDSVHPSGFVSELFRPPIA
ncbi:MAG: hypothetical protein MJE77_21755 [Proteobacteria bacterium]|nr:hypothetical protein [Pseudomonadota bacterium]